MDKNGVKNLTPEEEQAKRESFLRALKEEFHLIFTREELLTIHSILGNVPLKFGDLLKVKPVIDKIEPIVTVEPDLEALTRKAQEVPTVIGFKKENN